MQRRGGPHPDDQWGPRNVSDAVPLPRLLVRLEPLDSPPFVFPSKPIHEHAGGTIRRKEPSQGGQRVRVLGLVVQKAPLAPFPAGCRPASSLLGSWCSCVACMCRSWNLVSAFWNFSGEPSGPLVRLSKKAFAAWQRRWSGPAYSLNARFPPPKGPLKPIQAA